MNRLSLSRRFVIGGLGLTALSACTGTQYNRPAGSEIDEGAFGDSTMQNMLVMNGEAPALSHLGTRFAAEVPTTINFAFNSSALDATARAVLDQQAAFIRTFPEVRFSVYGHTDKVGSDGYNKRLGLARAKAAVAYLASRGCLSQQAGSSGELRRDPSACADPIAGTREPPGRYRSCRVRG